jgi:hypothetical protein
MEGGPEKGKRDRQSRSLLRFHERDGERKRKKANKKAAEASMAGPALASASAAAAIGFADVPRHLSDQYIYAQGCLLFVTPLLGLERY